ncbi:AAA family ATPase [Maribacter sp. 2307UL18-2]|uniref:AAA family ATPase n=1 Tax=Maribacter sp. 2307UL18-2 TaxID=3386274 RepID=UPI0039BD4529
MSTKKIVITGGPSTGKTSVIEYLENLGYPCLHEVIRLMTLAQKEEKNDLVFKTNPIVSVADPKEFNERILNARVSQYHSLKGVATDEVVFFDRGIPDVLAYMDCFGQAYGTDFEKACTDHPYDHVFIMPPWKEIHVSDNERFENYEESLQVHRCLTHSYTQLGYEVEMVPKMAVAERAAYILDAIKNKT